MVEDEKIDIEKTINHWISRSDQDFDTMMHLYNSKDFQWALFMGHLVIERLLKAGVVKITNNHAPFIHDLRRLAKITNIEFDNEHKRWLDTITSFNLQARYDDYKQDFYKKCTLDYTNQWVSNIRTFREWIKMKL